MTSLLLAGLFFVGIHLFVAGTSLRDRLVAGIGERPYQGVFSLASLLGIVWLCMAYARAEPVSLWGELVAFRPVALGLMMIAFLFAAIGLATPNPTAVGAERVLDRDEPATGMLRVSRHPFLWGVALWASTHLVLNGDLASLVFFGALLVLALAGPPSIDAKRARRLGERWQRFAAVTSNVPFGAIVGGRNQLRLGEIGWLRVAAGLGLFALFLLLHSWLFGRSPYPI